MAKNVSKKIKSAAKKTSPITLVVVTLFFVVGIVGGFFGYKFLIKNDTFELLGEKQIVVFQNDVLNESLYNEESANVVIFGKQAKNKLVITYQPGGIDTSKLGTYYITYKVNGIRFFNVTLVRTIVVQERANG